MSLSPSNTAARYAEGRRAWSDLAAGADRYAAQLIETDGEEAAGLTELRGSVRLLADQGFPSGESSARMAGDGFVQTLRALMTAERPRRRVILAEAVRAEAKAIGELIVDTQETEALAWRAMTGEA